jgi:hypothetical protein
MRCLVKNFAMFGFAINIYLGEDLTFADVKELEYEEVIEADRQKKEAEHSLIRKKQGESNDYLATFDPQDVIDEANLQNHMIVEHDDKKKTVSELVKTITDLAELENLCRGVKQRVGKKITANKEL